MIRPVSSESFSLGSARLTRRQFTVRLFLCWIYSACWLAALFGTIYAVEISWLKYTILFALMIVTPTADVLFRSYDSYCRSWEAKQELSNQKVSEKDHNCSNND
jgi:hypothetical protein